MFSIEAENEWGRRWVSAICRERSAAEAFLASVPEDRRPIQRLVAFPHEDYPLFIVERDGFFYGDLSFVRRCLATAEPLGNVDGLLFNVYVLNEDFTPRFPGADCMGSIRHWHVTDCSLVSPRREEIEQYLQEAGHHSS